MSFNTVWYILRFYGRFQALWYIVRLIKYISFFYLRSEIEYAERVIKCCQNFNHLLITCRWFRLTYITWILQSWTEVVSAILILLHVWIECSFDIVSGHSKEECTVTFCDLWILISSGQKWDCEWSERNGIAYTTIRHNICLKTVLYFCGLF